MFFCTRTQTAGFTLIELLVVVSIVSLLVALLLPALGQAREEARGTVCASQLHQLGAAFHAYVRDYGRELPAYAHGNTTTDYGYDPYWHHVVSPYLGRDDSHRFGYNGPDATLRFLPCPSRQADSFFIQTYGVVYPTIFAFQIPPSAPGSSASTFNGSAKLDRIPSSAYIAADGQNWYGHRASAIINPDASIPWGLDTDTDGDGIDDTSWEEWLHYPQPGGGTGLHNGFHPVHNRAGNCLFPDGAVKRFGLVDWALNKGGFWGVGLPDDLNAYK